MGLSGERPVVFEASRKDVINCVTSIFRSAHAAESTVLDTPLFATEHLRASPIVCSVLEKLRPQVALTAEGVCANLGAGYMLEVVRVELSTSEIEGMHKLMR